MSSKILNPEPGILTVYSKWLANNQAYKYALYRLDPIPRFLLNADVSCRATEKCFMKVLFLFRSPASINKKSRKMRKVN